MPIEVSYQPIGEGSDLAGLKLISPLVQVENGGRVAEGAMSLRIPVQVPEGHFAMAFFYDEATGKLEGLPLLALDATSVTVATQHFSKMVVTAEEFSALEHMEVDTGFRPGKDTWRFQNQGTYRNPKGICWGMSVSSLYYYLEEPWQIGGERLWARYDNSLEKARYTPAYWQDDDLGLKVADAVQLGESGARRDRAFDVPQRLLEEARAAGQMLDVRLTGDQMTFYSLVTALGITNQPQLVDVSTADGTMGHSVICYGVLSTTLYLADPNDMPVV